MSLRKLPPRMDELVFAEPWQASAFAMTVALHERGVFEWAEWAEILGAELKSGDDYYDCWLHALEKLLIMKGAATPSEVADITEAWHRAAHATPHGKPILLENDPEGSEIKRP